MPRHAVASATPAAARPLQRGQNRVTAAPTPCASGAGQPLRLRTKGIGQFRRRDSLAAVTSRTRTREAKPISTCVLGDGQSPTMLRLVTSNQILGETLPPG